MNWNHRVMNCPSENGGEDLYTFKEVYYTDDKPHSYSEPFMCGDSVDELKEMVQRLEKALGEHVLHEKDFEGS